MTPEDEAEYAYEPEYAYELTAEYAYELAWWLDTMPLPESEEDDEESSLPDRAT